MDLAKLALFFLSALGASHGAEYFAPVGLSFNNTGFDWISGQRDQGSGLVLVMPSWDRLTFDVHLPSNSLCPAVRKTVRVLSGATGKLVRMPVDVPVGAKDGWSTLAVGSSHKDNIVVTMMAMVKFPYYVYNDEQGVYTWYVDTTPPLFVTGSAAENPSRRA